MDVLHAEIDRWYGTTPGRADSPEAFPAWRKAAAELFTRTRRRIAAATISYLMRADAPADPTPPPP